MVKNIMLAGMMGLVVGDALGCPVQFLSREEIKKRGLVIGMEGYGTYDMPMGTWTDDSSMALCELASINEKHDIDLYDIMDRFLAWEFDGEYTPFGEAFDEGNTCSWAIFEYRDHRDPLTCGRTGERANGNGALMRILPVCLYYINKQNTICTSDDEAIHNIHAVTALTHNHLRSYIASGLYYFMLKAVVYKAENETIERCLQRGLDDGFRYYGRDIRNLSEIAYYGRLFSMKDLVNVDEASIHASGYVVEALEAAIWCLITTDCFKDCLLKAVNLGDDTDTVAAIAGGLAGVYYGYQSIPEEWLEVIQRREWIESMCQ